MDDILRAFEIVLPYIKYLFDEDISIAIADREKFLLSLEGETIHMNVKSGDPIPQGGGATEVLRTGNPLVKDVPSSVYGVAFKSYAVPVKNEDDEVIGVLTLAKNYEKSERMYNISKEVNEAIQHISTIINEFSNQLSLLQSQNIEISQNVSSVYDTTNQTDTILDMIQKLAKKSNILGLNASIEAARAGLSGKGFTVVAKEIQNLGHSTLISANQIDNLLRDIDDKIQYIHEKVKVLDENFIKQTDDIKMIIDYIEELYNRSEELAEFASKI